MKFAVWDSAECKLHVFGVKFLYKVVIAKHVNRQRGVIHCGLRECAKFCVNSSDPNDPVFVASGVQGIAYSGAVCQDDSSGIVSLHDNIYTEASILAHELGHLLMLSHDTGSFDISNLGFIHLSDAVSRL